MVLAGRIFSISFAINAAMGASFSSAMSRSSAIMQQLGSRTRELNAEQRRLDRAWQESQNQIRGYAQQMQSLQNQYNQGRISESQYRSSMSRIAQNMRQAGMSAEEYRGHLQRLRREIEANRAAQERMQAAQARQAAASTNFGAARTGLTSAVATVGMAAAPIMGMVDTAMNFEAAMSKVQAITRANDEQIKQLTDTARRLGETTSFSAQQSAEAMSYLGMAGWDTNQIIAGMPGLLALAAAGGTDLARTADIVSDDLTAFGMSADQAAHMADVFAVTATRTNTNVEMIGETMKYAAPVAKAYGATMEETAALTGIMANAGVKASQAGTSLRAGFLRLAGPPKKASKAMEELGISLSDVTKQQQEAQAALSDLGIDMDKIAGEGPNKMVAVLRELKEKTANLSDEQKLARMQMIFGTEAATGWLNVLNAGPDVFEDLLGQMENCDGEAERMAAVMMNNAKGAITQLKSALEGAAISIGSVFLPAVTAAAKWGADMAKNVSEWAKSHEDLVATIGAVAAGMGAVFIGFKAYSVISTGIQLLVADFQLWMNVQRNTANGQRLLTAATQTQTRAMAALRTVASADFYRNLGNSARNAYNQMRAITWAQVGNSIRGGITGGAEGARGAFTRMRTSAIASMRAAQASMAASARVIAQRASMAATSVLNMARSFTLAGAASKASAAIRAMGTAIMAAGRASMAAMFSPLGIAIMAIAGAAILLYNNWEQVGPFFMGLWSGIQAAFANAWTTIQPAIARLQEVFSQLIAALAPVFDSLRATIQGAFAQASAVFAENSETFTAITNVLMTLAEVFGVVLVGSIIVFANAAVGFVTAAVGTITAAITGLIGVLTGIIEFITGVFTGNWQKAWQGIVDIFSSIFSSLKGIADGVLNGIASTVNGIVSTVRGITGGGGGGTQVAQNAEGGIYRKGAFLTTFAEEGPEAAIPLDGSPRAIGLWQKAGEILGVGREPGGVKGYTENQPEAVEKPPQSAGISWQAGRKEQPEPQAEPVPTRSQTANTQPAAESRSSVERRPEAIERPLQSTGISANIPITMNLNFYGDTNPQKVKEAVIDAGQKIQETLEEQLARLQHERGRLSFG